MPFSIYQIPLHKEYVQAEFHPLDHSIFLLYENGQLESVALSGERADLFSFGHKPLAFRITADGSLAYILCEGFLITFHIPSKRHTECLIDDRFSRLECYKDCAVLYGMQKQVLMMKPHGRKWNAFTVAEYIRQLRTVPKTEQILIYNEKHDLAIADLNGKTLWFAEKLFIAGELLVSHDGRNGYFLDYNRNLIKFNLETQAFVELSGIPLCTLMAVPADGALLLVFDIENNLRLFDEYEVCLWNEHLSHRIQQIKMASRGDYFAIIDEDGILTCFAVHTDAKPTADFLETVPGPRVRERLPSWSLPSDIVLKNITINRSGRHAGIVNQKGGIDFFDEQGSLRYRTTFPDPIQNLALDDDLTWVFITGRKQARLIDVTENRSVYFAFDPYGVHGVAINFGLQKVWMLSQNARLLIYDFKGSIRADLPSPQTPSTPLSCEKDGVALFHKNILKALSPEGRLLFSHTFKSDIRQLFYTERRLVGALTDRSLFSFDLETLKGRFCRLNAFNPEVPIVCAQPLLCMDENGWLRYLNLELDTIVHVKRKSAASLFFVQNAVVQEIVGTRDGLFGHDPNQNLSWRCRSANPIVASALMENGLIFLTANTIQYIRISDRPETESKLSKFLEI
ncbi:MAG: hypothetical protein EHM45_00065 [Desulfobacteraceae bacterium]|nr:MAG: hypothetical protein EHM45_00065 [Desulfobacteraceae bacterium]